MNKYKDDEQYVPTLANYFLTHGHYPLAEHAEAHGN